MKKIIFLFALTISGVSYAQNENIPEGWDKIFLEDKVAYMNSETGVISHTLPRGTARKPSNVKAYSSAVNTYQSNNDDGVHIVEKGDTFSKIARSYNMSLSELYDLNSSRSSNQLKIGQAIIVGDTSSSNGSNDNKTGNYHTVTTQETLYRISQNYGISVNKLKELNSLKSNAIKIGQRLIVR